MTIRELGERLDAAVRASYQGDLYIETAEARKLSLAYAARLWVRHEIRENPYITMEDWPALNYYVLDGKMSEVAGNFATSGGARSNAMPIPTGLGIRE